MFWIVLVALVVVLLAGGWLVDRRFRGTRLDRNRMSDERQQMAGKMDMNNPRGHFNGSGYNGPSS